VLDCPWLTASLIELADRADQHGKVSDNMNYRDIMDTARNKAWRFLDVGARAANRVQNTSVNMYTSL
jgi:hypothetical protein